MDLVTTHFDVLVLGAGPGGYVAAIRAAQLGKTVAVVEENYWGGVCLNVGCIPSKALLKNAELAHVLTHDKAKYGIEGDATMSFGPTHARSRKVSEGIVKGVHFLMKKNKITEIDGWGTLTGPTSIDVKGKDGGTTSYTCDDLIIATGAKVRLLPGLELSDAHRATSPPAARQKAQGSMICVCLIAVEYRVSTTSEVVASRCLRRDSPVEVIESSRLRLAERPRDAIPGVGKSERSEIPHGLCGRRLPQEGLVLPDISRSETPLQNPMIS